MKISIRFALLLAFAAIAAPPAACAQTNLAPSDPRFDWWRQARFGLFIHWGPVAMTGQNISWSRAGERRDRHEFITNGIPAAEYDNLYHRFNPTNFNASEWVGLARDAGMKYIVFTAKHHDGFCEFDSQLTDYKITRSPFGRDVCAELAAACKQDAIHLGFYYSPPDWHHPDYATTNHARYLDYFHGQIRELLTHYGPIDLLWFDHTGGPNTPEYWDALPLVAEIRRLQPQILMTKRWAGVGDYDTPERRVGRYRTTPWESCITLCQQWSWKPDDKMKSLQECVQLLVLCGGGDGNLLLNVGPMGDGRIEPRQVARLREIGAWLKVNGESIYGCRGGPWKPSKTIASVRKGQTVFLHVLVWNGDAVELPDLPCRVLSAALLDGRPAEATQGQGKLTVKVPAAARDDLDTIVRLNLDVPALNLKALEL